jgi:hypothetical protein
MLQALRDLLREYGCLSQKLLRPTKRTPSAFAYLTRFGSLTEAFRRVGYVIRRRRPMSRAG